MFAPSLVPIPEPWLSTLTYVLVALLVANSLVGGMSASGAFEVLEKGTGKVFFSKLATGRLPRLADVLESPAAPPSLKGASVPDKSG